MTTPLTRPAPIRGDVANDPPRTAPETAPHPVRPTSRAMWAYSLVVLIALLCAKLPRIMRSVEEARRADPEQTAEITDSRVLALAINIGVALALTAALIFVVLYQSLGRALEKYVYTASLPVAGRHRSGLFFLVSTANLVVVYGVELGTGQLRLAGLPLAHLLIAALSLALLVLFRSRLRGLRRQRVAILAAICLAYGQLALLI